VLCAWSYELILFLRSTKKLQILCLKYQVASYKIYPPRRPCARMHYGAVFEVLSVVIIEVKALNLLRCDVTQQSADVSVEPTVSVLRMEDGSRMPCRCDRNKFPLGYSMSASFH